MITHDLEYPDLGGDHYTRRNPNRPEQRALAQLHQLGYDASRSPLAATG